MNRVNGVKTVIFFGARLGGFRVSQGEVRNPSLGMKKRTGHSIGEGFCLGVTSAGYFLRPVPQVTLSLLSLSLSSRLCTSSSGETLQ